MEPDHIAHVYLHPLEPTSRGKRDTQQSFPNIFSSIDNFTKQESSQMSGIPHMPFEHPETFSMLRDHLC